MFINRNSYFGDEERPERDNGVSEGFKSVCPIGNPISRSTKIGCGKIGSSGPDLKTSRKLLLQVFDPKNRFLGAPFASALAFGVGNQEPAVSPMPGAEVGSAYAVPESIIPDLGQVSKDGSKSSSKDSWDVFQHDDCGSKLANKSDDLRPETASSAFNTSALSSIAKVLAWEAGADGVNWPINIILCEFGYVWEAWDVWPPLSQDSTREWFNLAKRYGFKTASHFGANAEAAYAAEKIEQL
jgi:hypothetical protein